MHHVLVIPGLGNAVKRCEWAAESWRQQNIIPHVMDARWIIEEPSFQEKLDRVLGYVDALSKSGDTVSLLGNSAGSSFVLNLFAKRKDVVRSVVINCGRIRQGDWPWFTFSEATAKSPSFRESVLMAEKMEEALTLDDRKKILTIRPIFDEVVPPWTVPISGATNVVIPSVGHAISIGLIMMSSRIVREFFFR